MKVSNELALHAAHNELGHMHDRFNALAQVAGREMPKYLKRSYAVPLTIVTAAIGAGAEARFGTRGAVANGLLAAVAYGVGMMSGDNPDLREGAYVFATGLGAAAASIGTYDYVTTKLAATSAPAAAGQ